VDMCILDGFGEFGYLDILRMMWVEDEWGVIFGVGNG
jgi:hypothetical protein